MIFDVTDRDFDEVVEQSQVPVLVEFWKPGCGSCRALMRELEKLELDVIGKVLILKMNVEENFQIPAELEVRSLPALALYRRGRVRAVYRWTGNQRGDSQAVAADMK